jgi:subtilase family serine protease
VAANADSSTAMALEYDDGELRPAPGISASGPLWAGVIALADQEAGHPLGFVNPAIYAIARGSGYHQAFHDVTTGDNSVIWPTGVFAGYTPDPAGTRSPAGAAPTPSTWSRCWHTRPAPARYMS